MRSRDHRNKGGRPKRVADHRTALIANQYSRDEEILPLQVMVENMRFWWRETCRIGEMVANYVIDDEDPVSRRKALLLLKRWNEARQHSQDCALDAAPYMHRRLASLTVEPPAEAEVEITMTMPIQIKGEDRSYREPPKSVVKPNGSAVH